MGDDEARHSLGTEAQTMRLYAYDLKGEEWYTNPHGNECPGHQFDAYRRAKNLLRNSYRAPSIVVSLRKVDGQQRIPGEKWAEKDTGRTVAGCLTDLAVMAKMGLVYAKVVLNPSDHSNKVNEAGTSGRVTTDIPSDLRDIIERLRPANSDENDDLQAAEKGTTEYGQIFALLLTVDHFLPSALKAHGISDTAR